jgi:hypothetical protein
VYKSDDISTGYSSVWADRSITINNPSMVARPKEDNTVGSFETKKTVLRAFRCDVLRHEHPGQVQVVQHFRHDQLAPYIREGRRGEILIFNLVFARPRDLISNSHVF